jgi:hypothetical protein
LERPADVRFGADNGLNSDIAPCLKSSPRTDISDVRRTKEPPEGELSFKSEAIHVDCATSI